MAILTIIFGFLSPVFSAIRAFIKLIPLTVWLCVVCVILGMVITSKGCSCRRQPRPPRPDKPTDGRRIHIFREGEENALGDSNCDLGSIEHENVRFACDP